MEIELRIDKERTLQGEEQHRLEEGRKEGYAMKTPYQNRSGKASEMGGAENAWSPPGVGEALEDLVRRGAQEMLRRALEEEVEGFLGRSRYDREGAFRGYRNGHAPERTVGSGLGAVAVRAPRVRDVPPEVAPDGYRSAILPRYQRRTQAQSQLFAQLYLEGLSSGDFEPVFRALLGEDAPLSASTMLRLKDAWKAEYEAWRLRPLEEGRYAYIWLDGIYVGCGQEREKTVLLCVLGAAEDGTKELLALEEGYRESTASWQGCCGPCGTGAWRRHCWRWRTAGWGPGRRCGRSSRAPATSAAGTIGC